MTDQRQHFTSDPPFFKRSRQYSMANFHPEDRPDPSEQPIRARVPDHVAAGAFSTGVIVMTAHSEFILDFVQNLGRPHQIVARVVMPHYVLPQLVDAMQRNIELYRNRWGELPQTGMPRSTNPPNPGPTGSDRPQPTAAHEVDRNLAQSAEGSLGSGAGPTTGVQGSDRAGSDATGGREVVSGGTAGTDVAGSNTGGDAGGNMGGSPPPVPQADDFGGGPSDAGNSSASPADSMASPAGPAARQTSVQDIYDDLKIRDEFLSGAYANAVMIGHGPHEFSFDFLTNFYPHSAVSSRVFLAAGQIPRLYESLKGTWEQLRNRMQSPPENPFPPQPPQDDNPFA